jgi:hypothetical protein
VRAERRCDELSIEGSGFGPDEVRRFVAGKPAVAGPKHVLPLDKDTPLSTAPGLPPAAVLHPRDELDVEIDVLERRGREARIFWVRSGFAVYGWVPAAALKRSTTAGVFGVMGGVPGGLPPRVSGQPFACNADLRLIVELAGRRVDVGKIRKGTRFLAGARRDGFVAIDLLGGPVERTGVAEWRVREAEFTSACAPAS